MGLGTVVCREELILSVEHRRPTPLFLEKVSGFDCWGKRPVAIPGRFGGRGPAHLQAPLAVSVPTAFPARSTRLTPVSLTGP